MLATNLKELVQRYNRPGPRYTSYPTAPQWKTQLSQEEVENKFAQLRNDQDPLPLSLYLHIPFCQEICHFCGCTTFQQKPGKVTTGYVDQLCQEIGLVAEKINPKASCVQMHWGGGTPTFLSEKEIETILSTIQQHFTFTKDAEIAIELDPRVTTPSQMILLRRLGFNRVSFGVQDFDPEVQKASNRIQSIDVTHKLYQQCRDLQFHGINFDLIYGLPKQSAASFAKTVERVSEWKPDRIALFSYAHVPWLKPFQRNIDEKQLPSADEKFETFLQAREYFFKAGYEPIGMDHFARPTDELSLARRNQKLRRNFQGYTVQPPSHVVALGMSAISDFGDLYWQNAKKLNLYRDALLQHKIPIERGYFLNANDRIRRDVIMQLMCNFVLRFSDIEKRHNLSFSSYFAKELLALQPLQDDGLVTMTSESLSVTELGQLFVRNVAMIFDDHLAQSSPMGGNVYSKTI